MEFGGTDEKPHITVPGKERTGYTQVTISKQLFNLTAWNSKDPLPCQEYIPGADF